MLGDLTADEKNTHDDVPHLGRRPTHSCEAEALEVELAAHERHSQHGSGATELWLRETSHQRTKSFARL